MQVKSQISPMIINQWVAQRPTAQKPTNVPFRKLNLDVEDTFERSSSTSSALSVVPQPVVNVEAEATEKPTTWLAGVWSAIKEFGAGIVRPYRQVAQARSSNPIRRAEAQAVVGDVFTDSSNHARTILDQTINILKVCAQGTVAALGWAATGITGVYGIATAVQARNAFQSSKALGKVKTTSSHMTETRMFAERQQEHHGLMKALASTAAALQFVGSIICVATLSATNPVGWTLIGLGITITTAWLLVKAGRWVVRKVSGKPSKGQMKIEQAKDRLMKALSSEKSTERREARAILKAMGILSSTVTAQALVSDPKHARALIDTKLSGAASWSI